MKTSSLITKSEPIADTEPIKSSEPISTSEPLPASLQSLYESYTGHRPLRWQLITGSASSRKYYRLYFTDNNTLIGVVGSIETENEAFLYIDKTLQNQGINIPAIKAVSPDNMTYLLEDLGDTSLYYLIENEGFSSQVIDYCKRTIEELVKFQIKGIKNIDTSRCFPVPAMAGDSIIWDLHYFKYCFAKIYVPDLDEIALGRDFKALAHDIENNQLQVLIHRDFQSRNIMINDGKPFIIDFQGARRGPAVYDLVSFLWQARLKWPYSTRTELIDYYTYLLSEATCDNADTIRKTIPVIVIFRMLQVLGAYGFRGLIQHNKNFTKHIPTALAYLNEAICNLNKYPYLRDLIKRILNMVNETSSPGIEGSLTTETQTTEATKLNVTVTSFSYKKGLPADNNGNGGGYVFDCRAIHNPGRYDQYKQLTGDDPAVIEFLENDGEITKFLTHCKALVDQSIEKYIKRGFTHLSIAFGCTGGQHRSVYSATHMAYYLSHQYNINVILIHREQGITKNL